jgi:fatty-acyl-CoA synthase
MLINAPRAMKRGIDHEVHCLVAAAAPPAAVIEGMGDGLRHHARLRPHRDLRPAAVCAKHPEWNALPLEEQVRATAARACATCCRRA